MRQILIAAIATFGLAGIAAAQDVPVDYAHYGYTAQMDANARNAHVRQVQGVDYSTTSSVRANAPVIQDGGATMEQAWDAHR